MDPITGIAGASAIALGIWYLQSKDKTLPPGPSPWPVVGNLISMLRTGNMREVFLEYRKQYGDIFTIYYGSQPAVVLCGQKMIRDAVLNNADYFSQRPRDWKMFMSFSGKKGIVWDFDDWKVNRTSALVALKDFGLGKKSLEERVCEEANALCEQLETMEGQAVEVRQWFTKAFSNVICTIVFGQRFEYADPKFTALMEEMNIIFILLGNESMLLDFLPMVKILPKFRNLYNEIVAANKRLDTAIKEIIEEHKQSYDSENLRDFIDLYLKTDPSNEETGLNIIKELFFGGTETSGTALSWAFLLLSKHPEIQRKCRDEVKQVLGSSRGPRNSDKGTLHYTEATLLECQRFITIAPVGLPHAVSEDVTFAGYKLKKGTPVWLSLDSCHHDPQVWPDHDKFRPERWLDASGKLNSKNSSFMAFSAGRRVCIGEQLARMELFIVFVSVLQRFEFRPLPSKPVSLEGHYGVTYTPVHDKLMYQKKFV